MPQELLQPDQFLERLETTFSDPSSSGAIWLNHKRYDREDANEDDVTMEDGEDGPEFQVLIRCTTGSGSKFSSRIPATRLPEFHARYGSLLKASMAPHMRKRDRKREKIRAEAAAKKKRDAYVDVEISAAGKRGKGRRQRMRKVAAQRKKEAEREKIELRESGQTKTAA
ncbi:signal recognition particle, SRP9/SRP14 subunit [Kockovaella imperatae]|uniref:Signal recognition particle subunit SRP14 n=1 Tax=Kockovaella imperatae TaxID=4999 RepID=A0A1Y1UHN6_9TREE|nr:signal recognition particle, SRP9/SRP14 subunit [Kockovaella imperatae]ORX37573.1 signal recognition particle, SRP9/SRP14 subunit [Kockovaella imperatae]